MAVSKLVKEALQAPLLDAGFRKKSDSWYWSNEEVILLVNLQKSQYGEQYYVNCGVALKSLGAVDFPKEHQCHIRFRLTSIVPDEQRKNVESVFDLEDGSFSEQRRKDEISKLIRKYTMPLLKECSSIDGIANAIRSGRLSKAMVHKQVKDLVS